MSQFVNELFKNEKSKETHVKIQNAHDKRSQKKFNRANTNVGVMNKFILQFSRVEKAYRLVEDAFIFIARSQSSRSLQQRMKRKCNMKKVDPILTYLGFGDKCFTNDELKNIFYKDPVSDANISFQRLLIGVGLCYFAKLEKEKIAKREEEKENSGTEVEYDDNGVIVPEPEPEPIPKYGGDDNDDDDDDNKQSDEELRFGTLSSGFEVVKNMFDIIDADGSGEISLEEFENSFNAICRDPEIVKQRMKELDYNNDENISFREFIFGISSWCGFNDEMIVDDADNDLDEPQQPLQPLQPLPVQKN